MISFGIENVGVGPARVHAISLTCDGKPMRNVGELIAACCSDLQKSKGGPIWRISSLHDQKLSPNRIKTFLLITSAPSNAPYWERLDAERQKMRTKVCYCSILDECWMLDSRKGDNAPVAACPLPQADDRPAHRRPRRHRGVPGRRCRRGDLAAERRSGLAPRQVHVGALRVLRAAPERACS